MPPYSWNCRVCENSNPANSESCTECSFPAIASALEIEAEIAKRTGRVTEIEIRKNPQSFLRRIFEFTIASQLRIAALALICASLVVITISWNNYNNQQFLDGILVEAHGMLLDILVIGLFILWLNIMRDKSERVRRYEEEIDDFREWKSEEASHRIAGNIRRLNAIGRTKIFLSRCYLRKANLKDAKIIHSPIHQSDLGESNLRNANLEGANLDTAFLGYCNMRGATLTKANLTRARLVYAKADGANFRGSLFRKAALNGASLRGADLRDCQFDGCVFDGADLGGADLRGATGLDVEALARAWSLSYARFDDHIIAELQLECPALLTKKRGEIRAPHTPTKGDPIQNPQIS